MPLFIGSIVLVIVLTAIHLRKASFHSKRKAMAACAVSGVTLGLHLGLLLGNEWAIALVSAAGLGGAVGVLWGRSGGKTSIIAGGVTGAVSGLAGAAAGMNVHAGEMVALLADTGYVLAMTALVKWEEGGRRLVLGKNTLFLAGAAALGVFVLISLQYSPRVESPAAAAALQAQRAQASPKLEVTEQTDLQTAEIAVGASGYAPEQTELREGIMAKLNFKVAADAGETTRVISRSLDIDAVLQPGDNYFLIRNLKPGSYELADAQGKSRGTIMVKANPDQQAATASR